VHKKGTLTLRKLRIALIAILTAVLLFSVTSGRFLVVNDLQRADVIVVLAGETNRRSTLGLQLLSQNYAPKMLLDVSVNEIIYDQNLMDIAKAFIQKSPQRHSVEICPIIGLSTKAEAHDVAGCLSQTGVHRILVVTSDYHTRRARSIFQHELRGYQIFVTPASDAAQSGASWWKHRQWAKMNFDEWVRLMWWELVDRWN
jgi:uncharacterized SAM-binding protein YcdF (DUF218 family)